MKYDSYFIIFSSISSAIVLITADRGVEFVCLPLAAMLLIKILEMSRSNTQAFRHLLHNEVIVTLWAVRPARPCNCPSRKSLS